MSRPTGPRLRLPGGSEWSRPDLRRLDTLLGEGRTRSEIRQVFAAEGRRGFRNSSMTDARAFIRAERRAAGFDDGPRRRAPVSTIRPSERPPAPIARTQTGVPAANVTQIRVLLPDGRELLFVEPTARKMSQEQLRATAEYRIAQLTRGPTPKTRRMAAEAGMSLDEFAAWAREATWEEAGRYRLR